MVKTLISLSLLLTLTNFSASAVPMATIMDPATPGYYKLVFNRFLDWYEVRTKNPMRDQLSATENKYIKMCLENISDWSYKMAPNTYWNYLRVTVNLKNGSLFTRKLALGPTVWTAETSALAKTILKEKKITLPEKKDIQDILWLEWDIDQKIFAVYIMASLQSMSLKVPEASLYSENVLVGYFYSQGKITDTKIFAARKVVPQEFREKLIFYPMISDVVDVIEDKKVVGHIYEVRSFSDQFIDEPLKTLANEINDQFRFLADSLYYQSPAAMEIYYP